MVKYIVSKLSLFIIFYELSVHEGKYEKKDKKKDLPWQSQNSEDEWNNTLRKVRLGIFKLYFEYVKKERVYH